MSNVRVQWFEIPVRDIGKAVEFYGSVLGQPLGDIPGPDGGTMKVFLSPEGQSGALVQATEDTPAGPGGATIYLYVDDIDGALARVQEGGGKVLQGKTAIGPYGFIGLFTDPSGNPIGLHNPG